MIWEEEEHYYPIMGMLLLRLPLLLPLPLLLHLLQQPLLSSPILKRITRM